MTTRRDPRATPAVDPEIVRFYSEAGLEPDRLAGGRGWLEFVRTQELLRALLPSPPARVLDVGGGPGRYSAWLAAEGYEVTLVDPVPALVRHARERAAGLPGSAFEAVEGDARALADPDASVDAVLLLGPLYHLQERDHRLLALAEAGRVLRPGGVVAAAVISRHSILLDAMRKGVLDDAACTRISAGPLRDGRFDGRGGFTKAYFHLPNELESELAEAGFEEISLQPVEGPGWLLFPGEYDEDRGEPPDAQLLEAALRCARALDERGELLEASAHILGAGRRPVGLRAR